MTTWNNLGEVDYDDSHIPFAEPDASTFADREHPADANAKPGAEVLHSSHIQDVEDTGANLLAAGPDSDRLSTVNLADAQHEAGGPSAEVGCVQCAGSGYQCRQIGEGQYRNHCISCVALKHECSLAWAIPQSVDLPSSQAGFEDWGLVSAMWSQNLRQASEVDTFNSHIEITSTSLPIGASAISTKVPQLVLDHDAEASFGHNDRSIPSKIGARFSRETVKVLRDWFHSHAHDPYPNEQEKSLLQRKTGLSQTQIADWFANARRRGKVTAKRPTSPMPRQPRSLPIKAWRRTEVSRHVDSQARNMNPLERWVDSPPEDEAASMSAIARALSSKKEVLVASPQFVGEQRWHLQQRIICFDGGFPDIGLSGSHGLRVQRTRRRRRKKAFLQRNGGHSSLLAPLKTFQCTFCTETFGRKYDWQRHEKSLHLSLERWICAPDGCRVQKNNQTCCVFCGIADPDEMHLKNHNYSMCHEKPPEERTFFRKDHLRQHLRLVHSADFLDWCTTWQAANIEIRSRCGFCDTHLESWEVRVEHLAEHFRTGCTMADWKGGWGFEAHVIDMVENAVPPYLIEDERYSPFPFAASDVPVESPRSAYELIKLELSYFVTNYEEMRGEKPADEDLQLEACRIIFASEVLSQQGISSHPSWLRDLLMSSNEISQRAQFGPLRSATENRLAILKINGKDNLFERCPMEQQLHEFAILKLSFGLEISIEDLREEACRIIGRAEEISPTPWNDVASWLLRLANLSRGWLCPFRQRAQLSLDFHLFNENIGESQAPGIEPIVQYASRLPLLAPDDTAFQLAVGRMPSGADLLSEMHGTLGKGTTALIPHPQQMPDHQFLPSNTERIPGLGNSPTGFTVAQPGTSSYVYGAKKAPENMLEEPSAPKGSSFTLLNEANCYRRLARELARFVKSTMSPNNPQQRLPTDDELQYQARWILYDE
ncbi:hypothetical protein ACJ41O_012193 [Fusarium nematophilum]